MLPQLVGMSCAVCSQRVGSEVDGRFCEVCGNPIHNGCSKCPPAPASNDDILSVAEASECPRCGADPHLPIAVHIRRATIHDRVATEVAPFRRAVESDNWWKLLSGLGLILGAMLLVVGTVALASNPQGENRTFAILGIGFGLTSFVAGVLFVGIRARAARHHRETENANDDEPPE